MGHRPRADHAGRAGIRLLGPAAGSPGVRHGGGHAWTGHADDHDHRSGRSRHHGAGRRVRLRHHPGLLLRLQHAGEGRPALRQDRSASVPGGRGPGCRQPGERTGAAEEGPGEPGLRQGQLRARPRTAEPRHRLARHRRQRQERLRSGRRAGEARRVDDPAAPGEPARGAGEPRLHEHHLAGRRHRRLAQRQHRPDGRGELPDADAVPDRAGPDQDAGRHQRERVRRRQRARSGRSASFTVEAYPGADVLGHGRPRCGKRRSRCRTS